MKRIFLAAMASSMLALVAPGIASAAHNGKRHHAGQHSRTHARHANHAHMVTFTAHTVSTAPSGPATTAPTTETVGTVTSFTNGVLTITLSDGTMVSGKVTEDTEIQCQPATPPTSGTDDESQGAGGDDQSGSDGEHGTPPGPGPIEAERHGDSLGSDGGGDGGQGEENCTVAALVPKTGVRTAELKLSDEGAVWEKVDLVR
jgi:hypothetical protein